MIRSQSVKNYNSNKTNPGNINSLIYKSNNEDSVFKSKRTTNPKVYQSFSFSEATNENEPYRRGLR
jgi:hypothetical protein